MSEGVLLLATGALLAGALAASLLASRLRVPGLVVVLGVGMAIGSDGAGWIHFDDYELAERIGVVALAAGVAIGLLAVAAMRRVRLASAGLYPVASIAAAALAYGAAATLHGSGFLSVYLCGLALGSAPTPATRTITTFHDGLAWIAQLTLFLTLGLLVFPAQLGAVALEGTVLAFVVAVVARPVAAIIATALHRFTLRERLVLGWAGLRGAVPVVLAIFPVLAHVPDSLNFFNIVFFAVVLSTVVQGATFVPFAERLGVTTNEAALPTPLMEAGTIRRLGAEVVEYPVRPGDAIVGRRVRELGLPREALLNVIVRGDQAIPPRGSTMLEAGDRLHVLVRQEVAVEFRRALDVWRTGPLGGERRHAVTRGSTAFTTRPWRYEDGDPGRPRTVGRVHVVEQLRTRRDAPGAVVALADGRFAFTGPVVAIGSAQQVQDAARRRLRIAASDADAAWWREVIGALAVP